MVMVGVGGGTTLINRSRPLAASQAMAGRRGRKRRVGVGMGVALMGWCCRCGRKGIDAVAAASAGDWGQAVEWPRNR